MRSTQWSRLFALSCSIAIVLGQQVDPERLEALKEFQRYFKRVKTEAEQVEAVMMLKDNECPQAADELLRLLKHPVSVVQQTAFAVLGSYQDPATFQPWLDSMATLKDDEQRATLIKVFGRARMKAALPAVLAAAQQPKASSTLRFEAARALAKLGDVSIAPALQGLLQDADPLVRMATVDAIGELQLADLATGLVPLLKDPEWQVQAAAVTAVAQLRPQAAVQPLIDLMRQPGRLQTECSEALFRITGLDFGVEPDRWQEQWTKLMAIPGWRIPTAEELAKKAESRAKYDELYGRKTGRNTFAGIPTTSTRVMFIIDVSGSMDDLVVERDRFEGYRDFKKFTVVKAELLKTLDTLTQDTNFEVVAFASDVMTWKPKPVPANVINRESAKDWVERLKPIGGTEDQQLAASGLTGLTDLAAGKTNTLKALFYPFGIDPDQPVKVAFTGGDKVAIKNKIDTVYFLSDGRPSIGKLVDTIEILKEVRRYNELFRIVFHAIAIGDFEKEFLRDLATQNGGVYVDLGR